MKTKIKKIRYENQKLINSIRNKEQLSEKSIIVPIYKKGDKRGCINYRGK